MCVIYGFDRLTFITDASIASEKIQGCRVNNYKLKYCNHWRTKIDLSQPSAEDLLNIYKYLKGYQVRVSYAEIAVDTISRKNSAYQLLTELLGSFYFLYLQSLVQDYKNTFYIGNRKSPVRVAMYADKPSKLAGATSSENVAHLEYRISGTEALSKIGLISLQDAIDFNFKYFFEKNLRFLQLPKAGILGKILAPENASNSAPALRKRARSWKKEHSLNHEFVMHNALRKNKQIIVKLKSTHNFENWLKIHSNCH